MGRCLNGYINIREIMDGAAAVQEHWRQKIERKEVKEREEELLKSA